MRIFIVGLIGLVIGLSGCTTIRYTRDGTSPKKEIKTYEKYDKGFYEKSFLDKIEIIYSKGGRIEYKAKVLGSGIKILNRLVEIEKEFQDKENE